MNSGCEYWHDCFTCPFPECKVGSGERKEVTLNKYKALELLKQGYSVKGIALKLNKSQRTIERYLRGNYGYR